MLMRGPADRTPEDGSRLRKLEPGAYFGVTTPLHARGGLAVAETIFAPGLIIPRHEHEHPFICFVLEGMGMRSWPARAGREGPMSLTVFPCGVPHANRWSADGGRALHLEFAPRWLAQWEGLPVVLDEPADVPGGLPARLLRNLLRECCDPDGVTPLAVEGLVLEMLAACARFPASSRVTPVPPAWLGQVRAMLHDRFRENVSLSEIAAELPVSVDHVARTFRRHMGCTLGEYLRRLRIDFACGRLVESRETLATIALEAGFADQSHFTRVFRRQLGVTPAAFRKDRR